jgi:hypothetical protein
LTTSVTSGAVVQELVAVNAPVYQRWRRNAPTVSGETHSCELAPLPTAARRHCRCQRCGQSTPATAAQFQRDQRRCSTWRHDQAPTMIEPAHVKTYLLDLQTNMLRTVSAVDLKTLLLDLGKKAPGEPLLGD